MGPTAEDVNELQQLKLRMEAFETVWSTIESNVKVLYMINLF